MAVVQASVVVGSDGGGGNEAWQPQSASLSWRRQWRGLKRTGHLFVTSVQPSKDIHDIARGSRQHNGRWAPAWPYGSVAANLDRF